MSCFGQKSVSLWWLLEMSSQGSSAALQQHWGKVRVVELEMSLVVELKEGRWVGMVVLQVEIVDFGLCSCVPAVFANVHLGEKSFNAICEVCSRLPLTSFACSRTGAPPRVLWGSGFPVNNAEWTISRTNCTCRVELLIIWTIWVPGKKYNCCNVKHLLHLYEFLCVFSSRTCRWSLFHRRYKDSASRRCGISCVCSGVVASWNPSGRLCTWTCRPPRASPAPLSQARDGQEDRAPEGSWSRDHRWSTPTGRRMECQTGNIEIQNELHISVFHRLKCQTGKHNQSWIWMYKCRTVPNWAAINSSHRCRH